MIFLQLQFYINLIMFLTMYYRAAALQMPSQKKTKNTCCSRRPRSSLLLVEQLHFVHDELAGTLRVRSLQLKLQPYSLRAKIFRAPIVGHL